jgi:hypothetical protein
MKPDLTFESSPEFSTFKGIMKTVLAIPKAELDKRLAASKEASPRKGNPDAPGRKRAAKS